MNSKQVENEEISCKQNNGSVSSKEVFIVVYRGDLSLCWVELFTRAESDPKGCYEQVSHGGVTRKVVASR